MCERFGFTEEGIIISITSWRVLKLLFIKEIQNKTKVSCYSTHSRLPKIKQIGTAKCCQGCRVTRTLIHGWWNYKMYNHLENSLAVSDKVKYIYTM